MRCIAKELSTLPFSKIMVNSTVHITNVYLNQCMFSIQSLGCMDFLSSMRACVACLFFSDNIRQQNDGCFGVVQTYDARRSFVFSRGKFELCLVGLMRSASKSYSIKQGSELEHVAIGLSWPDRVRNLAVRRLSVVHRNRDQRRKLVNKVKAWPRE